MGDSRSCDPLRGGTPSDLKPPTRPTSKSFHQLSVETLESTLEHGPYTPGLRDISNLNSSTTGTSTGHGQMNRCVLTWLHTPAVSNELPDCELYLV